MLERLDRIFRQTADVCT